MPQDDVDECYSGSSGAKGPDEEAGSDSSQDVTLPIASESDLSADEGGSGTKDHDEEAESKQGDIPHSDGDNDLSDPGSEEDGSGNDDRSENSSEEGDCSPNGKHAKMD